ncbi:MAG: hypothetical protein V3V97_04240 [Hyphomicrobiaceae bacterium]
MSMKAIRLELARDHDFPNGSRECGYVFVAPLDDNGRIDATAWKSNRERCRVRRFWNNQPEEVGHLVRKPGGSWAFHYDIDGDEDDDETGYRFGAHAFRPGEYVSIKEHDDTLRTFRVVTVDALPD